MTGDDRVQRFDELLGAIRAELEEYPRSFQGAVSYWQQYAKGDQIAAYLRSGRALSADDREWLASFVEGKIRSPRGRPPGFNQRYTELRWALAIAAFDVKSSILKWTAAGEKRRGLTPKAIEAAAAEFCPSGMEPVDFHEKLAIFIARSTRQR